MAQGGGSADCGEKCREDDAWDRQGAPCLPGEVDALYAVAGPRAPIRTRLDLGEQVHGMGPVRPPHGEEDLYSAL